MLSLRHSAGDVSVRDMSIRRGGAHMLPPVGAVSTSGFSGSAIACAATSRA
jgi:hypothetical protein